MADVSHYKRAIARNVSVEANSCVVVKMEKVPGQVSRRIPLRRLARLPGTEWSAGWQQLLFKSTSVGSPLTSLGSRVPVISLNREWEKRTMRGLCTLNTKSQPTNSWLLNFFITN